MNHKIILGFIFILILITVFAMEFSYTVNYTDFNGRMISFQYPEQMKVEESPQGDRIYLRPKTLGSEKDGYLQVFLLNEEQYQELMKTYPSEEKSIQGQQVFQQRNGQLLNYIFPKESYYVLITGVINATPGTGNQEDMEKIMTTLKFN